MSEHTVILEVAEGYSKDLKANVLAIVGKGECHKPGGQAVAVVALSHKAEAKDRYNAAELALRWNAYPAMLEALEAANQALDMTQFSDGKVHQQIREALAQARGEKQP